MSRFRGTIRVASINMSKTSYRKLDIDWAALIKCLSNVRVLHLSNTAALPARLAGIQRLRYLEELHIRLEWHHQGCPVEFGEVAECKNIRVLSVDISRPFPDKGHRTGCTQRFVFDIAAVVSHLPNLSVFRMNASRAGIGLPAVVALLCAIGRASRSLHRVELQLDENEIEGDCLTATLGSLTRIGHFVLSLQKNSISCRPTVSRPKPEDPVQFGAARKFVCINLAENAIGDEGAVCVANFLAQQPLHLELLLDNCSIGTHGATALVRCLALAKSYTFHNNPLSDGCFTPPIGNSKTVNIMARNSGLRDANVHTLVNRLLAGEPKSSIVLDLAKNHITDWGAKQLALCLRTMSSVPFVLILNENQVSDSGLQALLDPVHSRSAKMDIDIRHNFITDVGVADVPMLCQTHAHVSISVQGNLHDHAKYAAQVELWRTRGPMHQLIRSWEATNTFPHGLNVNTLKRKYAFTEEVSSSAVCSSEQPLGAHCKKNQTTSVCMPTGNSHDVV